LDRGGLFLHRGEGPTPAGRLLEGRGLLLYRRGLLLHRLLLDRGRLLLDRGEGSIASASGWVKRAASAASASGWVKRAASAASIGWCLRPTPASTPGQILGTATTTAASGWVKRAASAAAVSATAARRIGCGLASATERILGSSFPAEEKGEAQYNNQRHGECQGQARVFPRHTTPTSESSFFEAEVVPIQPRRAAPYSMWPHEAAPATQPATTN